MKKTQDTDKKRPASEEAARYLARRMRTTAETERHLAECGYTSEEIAETVDSLMALHYLDDREYAMVFFAYSREKYRGRLRIMRELRERGIGGETAEFAWEDFIAEDGRSEEDVALAFGRKALALTEHEGAPERKDIVKIGKKLEQRGFSQDVIFHVMDKLGRTEFD